MLYIIRLHSWLGTHIYGFFGLRGVEVFSNWLQTIPKHYRTNRNFRDLLMTRALFPMHMMKD
jgi:hypothetical protein